MGKSTYHSGNWSVGGKTVGVSPSGNVTSGGGGSTSGSSATFYSPSSAAATSSGGVTYTKTGSSVPSEDKAIKEALAAQATTIPKGVQVLVTKEEKIPLGVVDVPGKPGYVTALGVPTHPGEQASRLQQRTYFNQGYEDSNVEQSVLLPTSTKTAKTYFRSGGKYLPLNVGGELVTLNFPKPKEVLRGEEAVGRFGRISEISPQNLYTTEGRRSYYDNGLELSGVRKNNGSSFNSGFYNVDDENKKIQKLSKLAKRIEIAETARQKLGIEKGIQNIESFYSGIFGEGYFSGLLTSISGSPFYAANYVSMFPTILLKTSALGAGLMIPSTREDTLEESRLAFDTAKSNVKWMVTTPKGLGFLSGIIVTGSVMKNSPVKVGVGKVSVKTKSSLGELNPMKSALAKAATKEGGYIGGQSAVELQMPKGSVRIGQDVDIYFKQQGKVSTFAPKALKIAKGKYKEMGLDSSRLVISPAKHHIKVIDTLLKKDIADIGFKGNSLDKIVNVGGINARYYKQVLSDKSRIIKFVKDDVAKVSKAKKDIALAKKAERNILNEKTIYRGVYLTIGEGNTYPLVGIAEKGLSFGFPKSSKMPSLSEAIFPKLSRKNIASYPQTPLENAIMTKSISMDRLGINLNDVRKVELTKLIFSKSKDINRLRNGELPPKTAYLTQKETTGVYKTLRENPNLWKRIYGSVPDVAQRLPELKRIPGDIELEFISKPNALKLGGILVQKAVKRGKLIDKTDSGLGIYVKGEKAIELKYHGEKQSKLELSKGFRYGIEEYRRPTRIQGLRSQSFGEQTVRKGGAAATWWTDYTKSPGEKGRTIIEPPMHRPKDVVDFYAEISSAIAYKKLHPKYGPLIEEYRNLEWQNPEVKAKFLELDKNRKEYLSNIKTDFTELIKAEEKPVPPKIIRPSPLQVNVVSKIYLNPSRSHYTIPSYPSISKLPSPSKSISPSMIISPSPSPYSPSSSPYSPSPSPPSPSPYSPSPSPPSPSPYKSPSPSPSPYKPSSSPSPSPSPHKKVPPPPPPKIIITKPGKGIPNILSSNRRQSRRTIYNPSLGPSYYSRYTRKVPKRLTGLEERYIPSGRKLVKML